MFHSFLYFQNILDNFNPASRQMINTGKAYLKSLHGKIFKLFIIISPFEVKQL